MQVVPLQVTIGLRPNGHADHPAWEQLPLIAAALPARPTRERIDQEVRRHWLGSWHYDKTSGHEDDTPESPRGQQFGLLFVSRAFADAALATFPALVTELTQTQAREFWDSRAMIRLRDEDEDETVLQGLLLRRQLLQATNAPASALTALDTRIRRALDPDDPEPGVRRNPLRRFATAQARLGLTWHPSVAP